MSLKVSCAKTNFGPRSNDVIPFQFKQIQTFGKSNSALHCAIQAGHSKSIEYLLRMKSDPNVRNQQGHTPLMHCCRLKPSSSVVRVVKTLIRYGADITAVDYFTGANVLGQAIQCKNTALVKLFLSTNDFDLHHRDKQGCTVLHYIAEKQEELATIVIDAATRFHVEVDVVNDEEMTPLMLACYYGNTNVARKLVLQGASLTARDARWYLNALEWYQMYGKKQTRFSSQQSWPDNNPFFDLLNLPSETKDTWKQDWLKENKTETTEVWLPKRHSLSSSIIRPTTDLRVANRRVSSSDINISIRRCQKSSVNGNRTSVSNNEILTVNGSPLIHRVFTLYEMHLSKSFRTAATPHVATPVISATDSTVGFSGEINAEQEAANATNKLEPVRPQLRRKKSSMLSLQDSQGSGSLRTSSPSSRLQKSGRFATVADLMKLSMDSETNPDMMVGDNTSSSRVIKSGRRSNFSKQSSD